MEAFILSGSAVDAILLLMVAEGLWLARRQPASSVLFALLPGAFLLLALRVALSGQGQAWWAVALLLLASLAAHLADLGTRGWFRRRRAPPERQTGKDA